MKNSSIRRILMVIVGIYLAYTGFDLTRAVIGSSEKNKWVFLAFAALFLVFGAAVIVMNVKGMIQDYKDDQGEMTERSGQTESEPDRRLLPDGPEEEQEEKNSEDREEDSHCG